MKRWIPIVAAFLLSSCNQGEDAPAKSRRTGRFEPPADGRLEVDQLSMYVEVQKLAMSLAAGTEAPEKDPLAGLERYLKADLDAVAELGYDANEYRWVKDRVLEAEALEFGSGLDAVFEHIGQSHASREGSNEPALAHNRELVARYRAELESIPRPPAPGL
ncbi:MAG: hypothetical protein ACRD21_10110 [Vicinamibacteria bacterium]